MGIHDQRRLPLMLVLSLFAVLAVVPEVASAADCGHRVNCEINKNRARVTLTREQLAAHNQGRDPKTGRQSTAAYDYTSTYACPFSRPGGLDPSCSSASAACVGNTAQQGQGPWTRLYRRELDSKGSPVGGWEVYGTTCLPEAAPGKPVLGLGQIISAFENTPWSKPSVHIQPEGNTTLVTLPAYFEVRWPEAGFQPGEVNTVTLLGSRVRIRPTLGHYTYTFGDGTAFGPTTSPGGPYPVGDIQRGYDRAGVYATGVRVTYSGQFSVNGGEWVTIPDTVEVTGPTQALTVRTARSRLVTR